jgi:glyceraldehyde-3-phosphate dehydrogenase/erythrose-4-phosphate dehydrogenase
MLIKTGDVCEIHGSLLVEERIKVHIHMTSVLQWIHNESVYTKSVYNGHVSLSDTALYIERSMVKENIF